MALTPTQIQLIAYHTARELAPANGQCAWQATEIAGDITSPDEIEPSDYKKIVTIMARDWKTPANPVNGLYFRLAATGDITDPEVARICRARPNLPAEGIRIQGGADDPFAVLSATESAVRAAGSLPRTAAKLGEQVRNGTLTEDVRDRIMLTARQRANDKIAETPGLETEIRKMLPA